MGFKLPGEKELSREQLAIINLPVTNNYVIQGGPGTGKTVMTIYRAEQVISENVSDKKVLILVFNKPLSLFIKSAVNEMNLSKCKIYNYNKWLSEMYKHVYKTKYYPEKNNNPDWEKIERDFEKLGKVYTHIIIDEAQDFPIELIRILYKLSENITCFIDPNQAMEKGKTQMPELLKTFCLECPFTLTRNFRNTKEINLFSSRYCQFGQHPQAYESGSLPHLIQVNNYDEQTAAMARIIQENPGKSIGIIVNKKNIGATRNGLQKILGNSVQIEAYENKKDQETLNFDINDVKIFTYHTVKGLEFDIVILPRFEKVQSFDDKVSNINRVYVASSRAIESLYIFYFSDRISEGWVDTFGPISDGLDQIVEKQQGVTK